MKNFALCYACPVPLINWSNVLLLGTDTHNMPGGEVNDGEMPEQTADRTLRSIGITASLPDIRIMGVIQHSRELVHVCHCPFKAGEGAARGWPSAAELLGAAQRGYEIQTRAARRQSRCRPDQGRGSGTGPSVITGRSSISILEAGDPACLGEQASTGIGLALPSPVFDCRAVNDRDLARAIHFFGRFRRGV